MGERITVDSLMKSGELLLYICDEIEDQQYSDDDYNLITDNLTEEECKKSMYYMSDYPRLINKLRGKFGKKNYHNFLVKEFINNSKYNEEAKMYEYESDNLSEFIIGTYMIDQILTLYKKYQHEDIYFNGFSVGDMTTGILMENCLLYNKKFSENRINDESDPNGLAPLMYNTNIPLNDTSNIFDGIVKNNNLLFYRILMYAPDKDCFREYEIPYAFSLHYKLPENILRYILFGKSEYLEHIKDEEVFFHTYF